MTNILKTKKVINEEIDVITEYAEEEGYYYSFEYEVTTSEGKRYLDVMLCGTEVDADGKPISWNTEEEARNEIKILCYNCSISERQIVIC